MKIQGSMGVHNVLKAYSKTAKKVEPTNKATDRVEISEMAREMQIARRAIDQLPEIREDKVNEIKALMQSGQYKPSAQNVLDKILGAK